MRWRLAGVVGACVLLWGRTASAHRIDEYLQATVLAVEPHRVLASVRMIPGVMVSSQVIAGIDGDGDGVFSESEEQAYAQRVLGDLVITLDRKKVAPELVSWSFPLPSQMREGLGEIKLEYIVHLPDAGSSQTLILANHHLSSMSVYLVNVVMPENRSTHILGQRRNREQSVYELDYEVEVPETARFTWAGIKARLESLLFGSLFRLGMRHIAEGTDHLLFLLALLLPAPLLVSGTRWGSSAGVRKSLWRIFNIVTAFTIGHSLTLSLAALGLVQVPARPVEVMIAVSILVSAIHALRPLFPGKEAWIAAFFGLIHGLAFAATLDRLGFGLWERLGGILAFNFGIETMQMLVVATLLPSLILMSRTSAYAVVRTGGAVFAAAASVGWIAERLFGVKTPVDAVALAVAGRAVWLAGALFAVSVGCWAVENRWRRREMEAQERASTVSVWRGRPG